MTQRVLVSAPYFLPVVERFRPRFEAAGCGLVVAQVRERLDETALLELIGDVDGILCGDDALTARVLERAPRLRVIAKWGTGIDSIDVKDARRRGIIVCNTPNAFTEPVADTVLGYLLCFARNLPFMDAAMRAGQWVKSPSHTLAEATLGILGVGNIGKAVARRARVFGMRVLGNDIREGDADWANLGVEMVDFDTLMSSVDYLSVNCQLNASSHHLIDARALSLCRPGAVLINTARGPIVDELALAEALLSGRLAGVALDVFEHEPLPLDSPLLRHPRALYAPHNSNSSRRAAERVHESTVAQLLAALGGSQ